MEEVHLQVGRVVGLPIIVGRRDLVVDCKQISHECFGYQKIERRSDMILKEI